MILKAFIKQTQDSDKPGYNKVFIEFTCGELHYLYYDKDHDKKLEDGDRLIFDRTGNVFNEKYKLLDPAIADIQMV